MESKSVLLDHCLSRIHNFLLYSWIKNGLAACFLMRKRRNALLGSMVMTPVMARPFERLVFTGL